MNPELALFRLLSQVLILALIATACQQNKQGGSTDPKKAEEIVSTRTMGLALLEDNQLDEAEAQFLKLIKLAPGEAIGYANLGLVYLRTGDYEEARKNLQNALKIKPEDPDIRFNLATSFKYLNDHEGFVKELEKNIAANPDHMQSLYRLAESYQGSGDEDNIKKRKVYLENCVELSRGNIVPRLHLTEALLRSDSLALALLHLQELRRVFPEFSEDALEQYGLAWAAMEAGNRDEALTSVLILHNYLKLTNPYQNGVTELKGYEGSSVGMPTFTFSKSLYNNTPDGSSILEALRFTDVSAAAGLGLLEEELDEKRAGASHMSMGDFNHDGSEDLYLGSYVNAKGDYQGFMMLSEMGRFKNVAGDYGIKHRGQESFASFNDFNNDGWFDLLVLNHGQPVLYQSMDQGVYEDVSRKAFSGKVRGAARAMFLDMDHEGDLDLLFMGEGSLQLMRNNGDGSFTDFTGESGLKGDANGNSDATFGDFDDDGDIDLVVLSASGRAMLYTNLREGRFRDITATSGLQEIQGQKVVRSADYNNDGYLDLFLCGEDPASAQCFLNNGQGTFAPDKAPTVALSEALSEAGNFRLMDAHFFDFNNDGWLDLFMCGIPAVRDTPGGLLLHNKGDGSYENSSHLLPDDFPGGQQIASSDFNNDGDLDLFLTDINGGIRLLRNDGGNANHHLKVRLRGIRTGSGKNNHYGIGARIELRAGKHYQMQVVKGPTVFFGLAGRTEVDVVRILWTNGTPQNIFTPGIEQDLIEEQQLKGSCPFLYAWNGEEFDFVKDVMWRSALGMPMGIMGGEQSYAFAEASEDYHRIPGHMLMEKDGGYTIQITEELWETIYLDKVELLAVDHPSSVDIFVDEHFTPPPYPPLKLYPVDERILPEIALNRDGLDVRELLLEKDNRYVNTPPGGRYQGITETSYLVLDPGSRAQDAMVLFLNGWIFPTDASINLALSQGDNEPVRPPWLEVLNEKGEWEKVIDYIGFPQGKNKTVVAELDGLWLSKERSVRICTDMQIYWDQAFFAPQKESEVKITRMKPEEADHHYRGFSRMYRRGGAYGPHWFDYQKVETEPAWRDLTGMYTRFGEVNELLQESDNMYIIANAGEETTIRFPASEVADLPEGWTRDFLIYCVGWVKDGDMNTAEGNRVGPLPYHGMTSYPYADPSSYPMDEKLKAYHEKYNTREVNGADWRRAIFSMQ